MKRRQQLAFGSLEVSNEIVSPEPIPSLPDVTKDPCHLEVDNQSEKVPHDDISSDKENCEADPMSENEEECEQNIAPAQEFEIYTPRILIHTPRSELKRTSTKPRRSRKGHRVKLHIYDVSNEPVVRHLNQVLAYQDAPMKLGGIFHAGIEINRIEWSFGSGMESETSTSGVKSSSQPTQNPQHNYRQTVYLGRTLLSREKISMILATMSEEYSAEDYDLLRRNCCHFADDLCRRLGVKRPPRWLLRLAKLGAALDEVLPEAIREQMPW